MDAYGAGCHQDLLLVSAGGRSSSGPSRSPPRRGPPDRTSPLAAFRFDVWHTAGGLEPAGVLNEMRRHAYPMSQSAWRRAVPGGRVRQRAADREIAARTSRS